MQTRRTFIKHAAAVASLAFVKQWAQAAPGSDRLGTLLPLRQLTRDGRMVTAFSTGGWHVGFAEDPKDAQDLIETSLELGVRFFDTARGYQKGRSEEYYGKFLTPKYRDDVFLMTKSPAKTAADVRAHLDASLKAMKTDFIDLWQLHAVRDPKDVDQRIKNGVLDVFLEAKAAGKVRYIGFTGHVNPVTHLYFLEQLDKMGVQLDTCQLPLNICDATFESFQLRVLPALLEREYGVIAMKTMAGGSLMGARIDTTPNRIKTEDIPNVVQDTEVTLANLHQYVYSLPVSSLCSGCRTVDELKQNIEVLNNLKAMSESDRKFLEDIAKPYAGTTVENYKRVLRT
ncbi:MAG: aldo/keto reductase [Verrucomicrobiota bacterium]